MVRVAGIEPTFAVVREVSVSNTIQKNWQGQCCGRSFGLTPSIDSYESAASHGRHSSRKMSIVLKLVAGVGFEPTT